MKKNEILEILLKSIIGFPIGVMLLIISYLCVYYIGGENVFENEINQLKDIGIFLNQFIVSGISYYIMLIALKLLILDKSNSMKERIISTIIMIICIISSMLLIKYSKVSEILSYIQIAIWVLASVLFCIIGIVIVLKDKYLINKKIKELNTK